jgi:hypothetical protein
MKYRSWTRQNSDPVACSLKSGDFSYIRCIAVSAINLLIVSALAAANRDDAAPGAHSVEIYHCDFSEKSDANFDSWPDGWTRLRGPGYPQYVKAGIVTEPESNERTFQVKLDGGAASVSTPPVPIVPRSSYVLEADVCTAGLKHDSAWLTLAFLDEQRQVLEEIESPHLTGTTQWTTLKIGPIAPSSDKTRNAVIILHVRPNEMEDLQGTVRLRSLRLARLPRMTLRAGGLRHLYMAGEPIEVTTELTGMSAHNDQVIFELQDPYGNSLAKRQQSLVSEARTGGAATTSPSAKATWKPPVAGAGFYRVNATMVGENGLALQRSISLAVIEPQPAPVRGEFGWSLPAAEQPLDFGPLTTVLTHSGVNWVKFPIWYSDDDRARADRLAWFAERLGQSGIEMVGLLDQPPPGKARLFGGSQRLPIALVFTDRNVWQPAIDPLIMRLSLKVHWWQLGDDDDVSYVGLPDLATKINELKQAFDHYGQESQLCLVWQPDKPAPKAVNAPWSILSYADQPGPVEELATDKSSRHWLTLTPLPQSSHDTSKRATDLLKRMIAAKASDAQAIFVPHPFDDEQGLFNADGTPGELYLPWRTTALAISGREMSGGLRLPHGSSNYVFVKGREATVVVWNDEKVREHAFLGENVRRIDLWGRQSPLVTETIDGIRQHAFEVGPEPILLTGVNAAIVRWCLAFEFTQPTLESVFGREQHVGFQFRNTFEQPASVEVAVSSPALWETSPAPQKFHVAGGEQKSDTMPLSLKADADSGNQKVRIDFTVTADEEYRFSVYRTLTVGLDDLLVELDSHLDDSGELLVKAHVTNRTSKAVAFRGTVFAPQRRRQQSALTIPAGERSTTTFRLADGLELIGQDLQLRLEEMGGSRVLNSHTRAEK